MERPARDEEREERIANGFVGDDYDPEKQAIGDWHYWVGMGYEL